MNGNLLHALETWSSQPAVEWLGWSLVHFLWQGTLLAVLVAALLRTLRSATAETRYLTACTGLLLMAACPAATFVGSWNMATEHPAIAARPIVAAEPPVPVDARAKTPATRTVSQAAPAPRFGSLPSGGTVRGLLPWLVAAWIAGFATLSMRLFAGWLWIQLVWRRRALPVAAQWQTRLCAIASRVGVARPVRLVESALVEVPALVGWLRPVILLPASCLAGLSPTQLEAILAHELAHVRRFDYLANLLQTALETLLFYHPGVWYVSGAIRREREMCCDDIAAQACGGRLEYARALVCLEALVARPPTLALPANGSLVARIGRLLDAPPPRANRAAWWVMAAAVCGVVAMVAGGLLAQAVEKPGAWGSASSGLRCRLIGVSPESNDATPELAIPTSTFANANDATFRVELKNVSDKPLTLLGVRYGDSFPSAMGKLAPEWFGPHLFQFEFTTGDGKPVPRAARVYLESMMKLSGASTHELKPGESLTVLLRPAKFASPMGYRLKPGKYEARVLYHGPSGADKAEIKKHWPDKAQGKAWSGEVTSNEVAFTVGDDPERAKPDDLAWGEAKNGLRAAVEFHPPGDAPLLDPNSEIPLNTPLGVTTHLQNVSDKPIALVSETWRQEDRATVTNEAGEEQELQGTWYSGWPVMVRWTLQPGESAKIESLGVAVAVDKETADKFEHPIGRRLVARPGKYLFRYTIRLGSIQMKDKDGNVTLPTKTDWQGELVTGATPLVVRARTPQDETQ